MRPTSSITSTLRRWRTSLAVASLLCGLSACANFPTHGGLPDSVPVGISGVQHMGPDFNVATFYIDDAGGANVSRFGGGGKTVCCGMLPRTWRPGMTAVVRWSVGDWSQENRAEIEAGNYKSVRSGGIFIATVPIERYEKVGDGFAHFFPGGKVRVVSSLLGVLHPEYPIPYGPHDDPTATQGVQIKALFSPDELAERKIKRDQRRAKVGDWR